MSGSNAQLVSLIERIERLEAEKREIAERIKQVYGEARGFGFEPKVIRQMIKERGMDAATLQEWQALCEIYRAALGQLDGSPLGDAARRRFEAKAPPAPDDATSTSDDPAPGAHPGLPPVTPEQLAEARMAGATAAAGGVPILSNPYPAGDPRRGAWDEGWCGAAGSDGMDIPPAFRRAKKKPKGDKP